MIASGVVVVVATAVASDDKVAAVGGDAWAVSVGDDCGCGCDYCGGDGDESVR